MLGRAHEMCRLMIADGAQPEKVWIQGHSTSTHTTSPTASCSGAGTSRRPSRWIFPRSPQTYVVDPSLFNEPVTLATWKSVQGDPSASLTPSSRRYLLLLGQRHRSDLRETNSVLATYRNMLKLRSASSDGPPPFYELHRQTRRDAVVRAASKATRPSSGSRGDGRRTGMSSGMSCPSHRARGSQLTWDVAVERASGSQATYWITVKNLSADRVGSPAATTFCSQGHHVDGRSMDGHDRPAGKRNSGLRGDGRRHRHVIWYIMSTTVASARRASTGTSRSSARTRPSARTGSQSRISRRRR